MPPIIFGKEERDRGVFPFRPRSLLADRRPWVEYASGLVVWAPKAGQEDTAC